MLRYVILFFKQELDLYFFVRLGVGIITLFRFFFRMVTTSFFAQEVLLIPKVPFLIFLSCRSMYLLSLISCWYRKHSILMSV